MQGTSGGLLQQCDWLQEPYHYDLSQYNDLLDLPLDTSTYDNDFAMHDEIGKQQSFDQAWHSETAALFDSAAVHGNDLATSILLEIPLSFDDPTLFDTPATTTIPSSSTSSSQSPATSTSATAHQPSTTTLPQPKHRVEKRKRNTEAARRYRQRKDDRVTELEAALKAMTQERDGLNLKLARAEAEVGVLRSMVITKP